MNSKNVTKKDIEMMKTVENVNKTLVERTRTLYAASPIEDLQSLQDVLEEPTSQNLTSIIHIIELFSDNTLLNEVKRAVEKYKRVKD